ncbi:MAG: PqqD family protein [Armatimonadetes bacterium]|nr:PqqD family protein [Armatimonadota bacterium]
MSALSETISKYIPFAPKKPKIDRKQALAVVPVRNPLIEWERKGKEIHLTIPVRNDRIAKLVKRLVRNLPDKRQVALDEVGSRVWELCNGERNINEIVESVSKDYKLTRREAEASVTMFLQTLAKRSYIGLLSAGGSNSAKRKR